MFVLISHMEQRVSQSQLEKGRGAMRGMRFVFPSVKSELHSGCFNAIKVGHLWSGLPGLECYVAGA